MPLSFQAKFLRVLQEKAFTPVGGREIHRFDARVIAASNRDLRAMVEAGAFRRDLFYRLNTVEIDLPPLRERREDIPPAVRPVYPAKQHPGRPPYQAQGHYRRGPGAAQRL